MIFPVLKERKGKLSPLCKSKAPGFHVFILFAYYRAFHLKKKERWQILHSHTGSSGLFLQHYLGGKSEEQALSRQYRTNTAEKNHQAATPVLGRGLGHPLPGYWFLFLLLQQLWWAKSHFPACTSSTSSSSRGCGCSSPEARKLPFSSIQNPPEKTRTSGAAVIPECFCSEVFSWCSASQGLSCQAQDFILKNIFES